MQDPLRHGTHAVAGHGHADLAHGLDLAGDLAIDLAGKRRGHDAHGQCVQRTDRASPSRPGRWAGPRRRHATGWRSTDHRRQACARSHRRRGRRWCTSPPCSAQQRRRAAGPWAAGRMTTTETGCKGRVRYLRLHPSRRYHPISRTQRIPTGAHATRSPRTSGASPLHLTTARRMTFTRAKGCSPAPHARQPTFPRRGPTPGTTPGRPPRRSTRQRGRPRRNRRRRGPGSG